YSARGEVTDVYESTVHSGGYYHLTGTYFAHGAANSLSGVPGLPTIYYGGNADTSGLDGEGRYLKVTASSGTSPVTGVTYTNSRTCLFGHDDLARINSANCGSVWSQTFSLDPFGNASKTGNITFQPGFDLTKNWFLPVTGFDNNGNLLSDVAHTYTWDAENK